MRRTVTTIALSIAGLAAFAAPAAASTTPPEPPETTGDEPSPDTAVPETTSEKESSDDPADTAASAEIGASTDTAASAELGAPAGSAVVVVDESGSELAAMTVPNVEPAWADFGEGDEPESGHEYLRVTVVVESLSPRGLFAVDARDFILQDADGFVTTAEVVPTAEQAAADEEPADEAELANTETIELHLVFETVSGVAPTAMFYSPSSDRLVTVQGF